jgi:hypothetical protein
VQTAQAQGGARKSAKAGLIRLRAIAQIGKLSQRGQSKPEQLKAAGISHAAAQ